MNNNPDNPYSQVVIYYYKYNISKYQLHPMVKLLETWV
jgi:hypothetical protein